MEDSDPKTRYLSALRTVLRLRKERPRDHEAVLMVLADAQGQALLTFHRESEKDPAAAGVRYHHSHQTLNEVWARLVYPEARIKALEEPPAGDNGWLAKARRGVARLTTPWKNNAK